MLSYANVNYIDFSDIYHAELPILYIIIVHETEIENDGVIKEN